jgi:exodeoxyribonuclease V alpha subunit
MFGAGEGTDADLKKVYETMLGGGRVTITDVLTIRDVELCSGGALPPAMHVVFLLLFDALNHGDLRVDLSDEAWKSHCGPHGIETSLEDVLHALGDSAIAPLLDSNTGLLAVDKVGPKPVSVYFRRQHSFVSRIRTALSARLAKGPIAGLGAATTGPVLEEILNANPLRCRDGCEIQLDTMQKVALGMALRMPFVIVSGGPGTGKTSIVATLLRALLRLGIAPGRVRLAAPTGRAAQRIQESLRTAIGALVPAAGQNADPLDAAIGSMSCKTVHSLLSYDPKTNRFRHNVTNPIEADVFIIDETSMVDAELMAAFLEAVPEDARLILLGDKDQLPPVEPGAVLADLLPQHIKKTAVSEECEQWLTAIPGIGLKGLHLVNACGSLTDHVVILDKCHRSGKSIMAVAGGVTQGNAAVVKEAATLPLLAVKNEGKESVSVQWPAQDACCLLMTGTLVQAGWKQVLNSWVDAAYFGPEASSFKACLGKAAKLGLDDLHCKDSEEILRALFRALERNRILTLIHSSIYGCDGINRHICSRFRKAFDSHGTERCFSGLPVLITRNDHTLNLSNGDVGIVLRFKPNMWRVVFERSGRFEAYPLDFLPANEPAFAMTVHKSQGSEYDRVLLVMPQVQPGGESQSAHPLLSREIVYTGLTRARQVAVIAGSRDSLRNALAKAGERKTGIWLWEDPGAAANKTVA